MSPASFPWITQLPSLPLCLFFFAPFFYWDYFLLQFLLTFISPSGVSRSDLILNHSSQAGWNQRRELVSSLLPPELNHRRSCLPELPFVPVYLRIVHEKEGVLARKCLFKECEVVFPKSDHFFLLLVFIFTPIFPSNNQQYLDYNDSRMCWKKQQLCQGQFWIKKAYFFILKEHNNRI